MFIIQIVQPIDVGESFLLQWYDKPAMTTSYHTRSPGEGLAHRVTFNLNITVPGPDGRQAPPL
jgi:hypothetical protein